MAHHHPNPPRQWIRDALERYEGALIAHARRITGDLGWARDAVQETFLRLCGRPRDEVEPQLASWLFTVCRNAAIDRCRKEGVMHTTKDEGPTDRAGTEPEPVAVMTDEEDRASLRALVNRLPEKQREVIELKFRGGLSYKEIHQATGLSISNVGFLIHSGLKTLRQRLSGDALEEQPS